MSSTPSWRLARRDRYVQAHHVGRGARYRHRSRRLCVDDAQILQLARQGNARGYLRIYGQGDALIVADASEPAQGEPLFVKLVEQGRVVYRESFQEQAARADRTWGRYRRVELSPLVAQYKQRFTAMRDREVAEAKVRLQHS
jgi:hypothetical protein